MARKGGRGEGRLKAYLDEMCEVAGTFFHHEAMNDAFKESFAVAFGEDGSEHQKIQRLAKGKMMGGREGGQGG